MKHFSQLIIILAIFSLLSGCSIKPGVLTNAQNSKWTAQQYTYTGIDHWVYESTSNKQEKPPLIILHQIPGLSKETLDYAETFTSEFSVYLPLLFGHVNMNNFAKGVIYYNINSEWCPKKNRPIHEWTRQLSSTIAMAHPGQNMGVIGMCLTGTMPLALLDNKQINAIVVSQPALPLVRFSYADKASLNLSDSEFNLAKQRTQAGKVKILGLRFENDKIASREKLWTLKSEFPDAYIDGEIPASAYQCHNIEAKAHSVLIDAWNPTLDDKHPVSLSRKKVKQFFQAELLPDTKHELPKETNRTNLNQ